MRYIATGQEVFRIDEFTTNVIGIPQLVLMERAALRIAEHVKERFPAGAHVLIVVESGNNGGDGIAAASCPTLLSIIFSSYYISLSLFLLQYVEKGVFYEIYK